MIRANAVLVAGMTAVCAMGSPAAGEQATTANQSARAPTMAASAMAAAVEQQTALDHAGAETAVTSSNSPASMLAAQPPRAALPAAGLIGASRLTGQGSGSHPSSAWARWPTVYPSLCHCPGQRGRRGRSVVRSFSIALHARRPPSIRGPGNRAERTRAAGPGSAEEVALAGLTPLWRNSA